MGYTLKTQILRKLKRENIWGAKHVPLNIVKSWIPQIYRSSHRGRKLIDAMFKELINDGWLILSIKRTGKGSSAHVSLNPRKAQEIMRFLEE